MRNVATRTRTFSSTFKWTASHQEPREARNPPRPQLLHPRKSPRLPKHLLLVPLFSFFFQFPCSPIMSVHLLEGSLLAMRALLMLSVFDFLIVCSASTTSGHEYLDAKSRNRLLDGYCEAAFSSFIFFFFYCISIRLQCVAPANLSCRARARAKRKSPRLPRHPRPKTHLP